MDVERSLLMTGELSDRNSPWDRFEISHSDRPLS